MNLAAEIAYQIFEINEIKWSKNDDFGFPIFIKFLIFNWYISAKKIARADKNANKN